MEALFIFIAKSSGLLVLFYCAYYFLLRKETFFNSSRWFLLAGLVTSIILPFLVYTQIVWIEPAPVQPMVTNTISALNYAQVSSQKIEKETFEINWNYILLAIYGIGFLALLIKFAIDFYSLSSVLKGKEVKQQADFKFVDIKENIAPFSYFDYIVYNSSMFTASELENIIEHEKVHSDQNHTLDVLISRVFCVLFWFNPIIWLYKKAILQNLEFIADNEAAKKISDKKAYQYTLLKITTHESCVAITNHFYQSLIKKRIVMLNKNQSKKRNYLKYYAIIPALVAFVFLFQIKTIAQEKERKEQNDIKEVTGKKDPVFVFKIHKNTTDQELKEMAEKLKKNHDIDVVISDVKRNAKKELTAIKVDIQKGTGEAQSMQVEGDEAIKTCGIVVTLENNGSKKIGLTTDGAIDKPMVIGNRVVEVRETNVADINTGNLTPPTPPIPPVFPTGPMPQAPPVDMSKMPKPPVAPADHKDKVAMAKFEKEIAEFEKKMEAFEPDMSAFEKQVDEIMSQREAIFEKEMAKYEIAMEKFNVDMDKFTQEVEQKYGKDSKLYEVNMKQYDKDMRQYEIEMKHHEKEMKQHEKELKKMEKESRKS
ncbi:M56 family metallopeptidase [Flavobacterium psychroterrae]|uniref:M56 family metallopeptidase n=1 Tax=Flavobacterium psychroterrae TaxID=2133767 RepID=A0ABS5P8B8_9FLAO|nr:M56 family metallopeptidase [Flavobacterium psychroterrae]MBS7230516.1 M56 family metallopeptidase [Flavobacterium psychroterrae]